MEQPETRKQDNRNINGIVRSGVLCTRDTIYNRPYYMVVYNEEDGTGKTMWIAKNASREFLTERAYNLLKTAREIEDAFPEIDAFKIDFAIDKDEKIHVIKWEKLDKVINMTRPMTDKEFADTKSFAKCAYLDTNHILSDGAYWNTLDQLGTNPRPLDYSLFKEVITTDIWNKSILEMGYTKVDGELMQKVGNKPYVSIDYTFEGLTPASIPSRIRYKLFDYYEECLKNDKKLHNNLEKNLIFNIYDFSTEDKLKKLLTYGFTEEETDVIRQGVFQITTNIIKNYHATCSQDNLGLANLADIRRSVQRNQPFSETNVMKLYKYIGELADSIKKYGTPQYTRQTRCTFLAKRLCETLVEKGYYTRESMDAFVGSIATVSTELKRDLKKYSCGEMSKEEFNELYGQLRSGIFDIRTDCFEKLNIEPFRTGTTKKNDGEKGDKAGSLLDTAILDKALKDIGLSATPEKILEFIIICYKNKDLFKFELTKSLNLLLEIIIRLGEVLGIAREDMSYLEISELMSYHSRDSYIQTIQSRRDMYHANTYLLLPDIIFDIGDIDVITLNRKVTI